MNPNAAIRDAYTARQIALGRYANMTANKVLALLRRVEADTVNKIANAGTEKSRAAQEAFLKEIRQLYKERYASISDTINADLTGLASNEADFSTSALDRSAQMARINASVQKPTDAMLNAAVNSRPFQGRLLKEWLTGLEDGAAGRVRDAIRIGYVEGEGIDVIVRRLRGTRAAGFKDGIFEVSRRGAEAMVRTAVNHTAQAARRETFNANADIIEGELYNALLDSRVTPICRGLDGNVYPLGSGPRPPQHISCRSYTSVVLKGFDAPPRTSYAEWFAKQSADKQDNILGDAKGKLYRDGKLPLDRFTDTNGRAYNLNDLKRQDPSAFEQAGL
jgi:SPP1 gp7 family putative phage head morphogenesis protein